MRDALPGSHLVECACADCKRADALPERLQGIAGAKQLTFIQPGAPSMKPFADVEYEEPLDPDAVVRPLL